LAVLQTFKKFAAHDTDGKKGSLPDIDSEGRVWFFVIDPNIITKNGGSLHLLCTKKYPPNELQLLLYTTVQ
jgi:hypothetical protein